MGSLSQEDQQGITHVWALFSAAPSKHRNLILRGILAQCCFQQLSFLSTAIRDLIKIDFISALPTELGYKIFCYLDTTSLCKAAQVSQRWRSFADDDVVWHRMCEQHIDRKCTECGWGLPLLDRKRLRTEKRQIQLRAQEKDVDPSSSKKSALLFGNAKPSAEDNLSHKIFINGKRSVEEENSTLSLKRACTEPNRLGAQSPRASRPWKDVYKARFKVGTNWKHGRCTLKILKGHTNGVMCMQLDDHAHILATGSYDATIKIWDLRSGQCMRTLTGHTSGVRCLQFDDNRLISGSIDRTLRVWNWRSPLGSRDGSNEDNHGNHDGNGNVTDGSLDYCLRTLTGHAGGVIGLHFDGNVLASGSTDRTVRIWDTGSRNTFLLRGHTDWVNSVRVDARSRTCFSASDDCTVRLWSLDTRTCLRIFEGHVGQVQQLVLMPPEFEPNDDVDTHNDGHGKIYAPIARRKEEESGHIPISNENDYARNVINGSSISSNIIDTAPVLQNRPANALSSHFVAGSSSSSSSTPPPSLSKIASSSKTTSSSSTLQSNLLVTPLPSPAPSSTSAFAPPTATIPSQPPPPPPPTYFLTSSLDSTLRLWSTTTITDTSSPSSPAVAASSSSPNIPCPSPSPSSSSTAHHKSQQEPTPISHPIRTFFGHVEGVWALAADTLRAVSGAEDRTVKIWDPRTGACVRTFAGHEAPVTCVALGDCRLVSGGEDCDIRVLGFGS